MFPLFRKDEENKHKSQEKQQTPKTTKKTTKTDNKYKQIQNQKQERAMRAWLSTSKMRGAKTAMGNHP